MRKRRTSGTFSSGSSSWNWWTVRPSSSPSRGLTRPEATCTSWPCSASRVAQRAKWRDFASPMPRMRSDSGTLPCARQRPHAAHRVSADLHERRLRVVAREYRVDVRRPLEGASRSRHQRDRPALAVAVHPRGWDRIADQVAIRDPRQVDAARRGEAVPLPQARVHLEQLVAAVARVAHELDLRDAVEIERTQEREAVLDDFLHPERLAGPGAAHVAAGLAQLVPGEEAERLALAVEVAAERPHLIRSARDQLLHHRL